MTRTVCARAVGESVVPRAQESAQERPRPRSEGQVLEDLGASKLMFSDCCLVAPALTLIKSTIASQGEVVIYESRHQGVREVGRVGLTESTEPISRHPHRQVVRPSKNVPMN